MATHAMGMAGREGGAAVKDPNARQGPKSGRLAYNPAAHGVNRPGFTGFVLETLRLTKVKSDDETEEIEVLLHRPVCVGDVLSCGRTTLGKQRVSTPQNRKNGRPAPRKLPRGWVGRVVRKETGYFVQASRAGHTVFLEIASLLKKRIKMVEAVRFNQGMDQPHHGHG